MWAYLADMSKLPTATELITAAIRDRIEAVLARQGHNLDWLAGEVGVTTHKLLQEFSEGISYVFLWDMAEVLGVSTEYLAVGRA